jgi:protocatechuate 3,4-dioxygenase beta subunit
MEHLHRFFVAFCILLAAVGTLHAQTATTGLITGTVTDSSGAVIPGAAIELENLGTSARYAQVTNESGHYTFPNLPPGPYRLKATQAGFRTARWLRSRLRWRRATCSISR